MLAWRAGNGARPRRLEQLGELPARLMFLNPSNSWHVALLEARGSASPAAWRERAGAEPAAHEYARRLIAVPAVDRRRPERGASHRVHEADRSAADGTGSDGEAADREADADRRAAKRKQ